MGGGGTNVGYSLSPPSHFLLATGLLLLSVLLAASVGTITIEQYPRISCHDNFVKAKDSSSRVRDRSWNMTFYLNVFYLLANNKRPCWILQVPE